jgi:glutamate dehydrogenase
MSTPRKSPAAKASRNAPPIAEGDSVSLDPIIAALNERVPKARQAQAEAFARVFYRRMSAEEMAQHSAQGWAELANDFLELAH